MLRNGLPFWQPFHELQVFQVQVFLAVFLAAGGFENVGLRHEVMLQEILLI